MSAYPRDLSATLYQLFMCTILVWLSSPDYVLCDCASEPPEQQNIITEADTLLPCYFPEPILSGLRQDSGSVIWTRNGTEYLVEIKLSGVSSFWKTYKSRFQTFPTLAKSGNFSLLLKLTSVEDVGSYECRLYEGDQCVAGHKIHHLYVAGPGQSKDHVVFYCVVGSGCAALLIIILSAILIWRVQKRRKNRNTHNTNCSCPPRR
ncbi:uncharacterized protein LOC121399826 [Xenopus laevis]|uniref:Uncharacterized protein LOC121399826 n=2 Tax=Xenopus laevis TaxID=8355 RepID=A0A1L8HD10_XENLA|nr:uncharacterized protein LOC121399826 [Xenopus laevis]OCT93990.1 hypothetical protein XELAEV_18011653mg [Xenopus laevis]